MFTRDGLNISEFRKIPGGANNSYRFLRAIQNRFDSDQQRPIQTLRYNLDCKSSAGLNCHFDSTGFLLRTGTQNLAATSTEQSPRMRVLERRARAIYPL